MDELVINGGARLKGDVAISGSKNAAVAAMAATLLAPDDCYLENVPDIGDVKFMAEVVESLGVQVERPAPSAVRLNAGNVTSFAPATELVVNLRASFQVMGPLLARFGEAACSQPGGDVIDYGHRTSASGGTLNLDANGMCAPSPVRAESASWPLDAEPRGSYTAEVRLYDACGEANAPGRIHRASSESSLRLPSTKRSASPARGCSERQPLTPPSA